MLNMNKNAQSKFEYSIKRTNMKLLVIKFHYFTTNIGSVFFKLLFFTILSVFSRKKKMVFSFAKYNLGTQET